jgi:diguanylate cyclase (GGDEF)-like protein
MNNEDVYSFFKAVLVFIGGCCLIAALANSPSSDLRWDFFLVLAFAVLVSSKLSLALPRSKFIVTFSDTLIIFTFLIYGGEAAIILSAFETLANCIYTRKKGFVFGRLMIPVNISITVISTTVTYFVWKTSPYYFQNGEISSHTTYLIPVLGILAFTQFLTSTVLATIAQSIKEMSSFWKTWKRDCFSSSISHLVGAGLAGIFYKLINYSDFLTTVISLLAIGVAYITYRQSIEEINSAIAQAEHSEREKAETEREKRLEVEKFAARLSESLKKEEEANFALRRSQKALHFTALHDSLTNLANRKQFADILENLIADYREKPETCFHILFLDINRFKNINDSLGHSIGDKVLMIIGKRFLRVVRQTDTVARIGGDEFAIILRNLSTINKALKVARKIHQSIAMPFSLSGNRIFINVNIGIAPCDPEYKTPEEILRDADIAMHFAKEKGTGVAVFSKELRTRFLEKVTLEADLRHAVERGELAMHYQPLISLQNGSIIGFEALLRWHHRELGMISPAKFIPIAEDSGLIVPITIWILEETCRQLADWQKISSEYRDLMMSINISGKHLSNDELIDDVEHALSVSGIAPNCLKLEITESVAMENAEHTISILTRLKQIGVQLSIDDFGTGYSSLSHLHRLPFDTLKIDRSFVYSVGESGENSEILQTIISLAKNLKMKIIAEGIETESQLALLQFLGCDYGQGYLLAKPQPKEAAEKMLYEKSHWLPNYDPEDFNRRTANTTDDNLPVF